MNDPWRQSSTMAATQQLSVEIDSYQDSEFRDLTKLNDGFKAAA